MVLSDEKIEEIKSQYGLGLRLERFEDPEFPDDPDNKIDIVLKPPTSVAFRRFMDESKEAKLSASTLVQAFVDPHVVYPDAAGFKKVTEKLTGVRVSLSNILQEMAGASGSRESKKL